MEICSACGSFYAKRFYANSMLLYASMLSVLFLQLNKQLKPAL